MLGNFSSDVLKPSAQTCSAYLLYRVAGKVDSESGGNQDTIKKKEKKSDQGSGIWRAASTYISLLLALTIIVGYPAMIMPLFRAAQTTDLLRVVITCLVHPLAHEFVAMGYRGASLYALLHPPPIFSHYLCITNLQSFSIFEQEPSKELEGREARALPPFVPYDSVSD